MIPYFPQLLFILKMDAYKTHNIARECYRAGIPCFVVTDSNIDQQLFNHYIVANTKNLRAVVFLFSFLSQLIKRSLVLKKVKFMKNVSK